MNEFSKEFLKKKHTGTLTITSLQAPDSLQPGPHQHRDPPLAWSVPAAVPPHASRGPSVSTVSGNARSGPLNISVVEAYRPGVSWLLTAVSPTNAQQRTRLRSPLSFQTFGA
jgi:hypothetical protein